jgi:hypothetical protein
MLEKWNDGMVESWKNLKMHTYIFAPGKALMEKHPDT